MKNRSFTLIDDDDLIHQLWTLAAQDDLIDLHTYKSVKDFISNPPKEKTIICLDSNLGSEVGENEASRISDLGFADIYLTTAKHETEITSMKYIKAIKGKKPLWRTLYENEYK